MVVSQDRCKLGLVETFLAISLAGAQPDVAREDLQEIIDPVSIQELGSWLPVEPANIEWAVAVADNILLEETTLTEFITRELGFETSRVGHDPRCNAAHLFVADLRVEVFLDPPGEGIAIWL
jgi:hypothetical protein